MVPCKMYCGLLPMAHKAQWLVHPQGWNIFKPISSMQCCRPWTLQVLRLTLASCAWSMLPAPLSGCSLNSTSFSPHSVRVQLSLLCVTPHYPSPTRYFSCTSKTSPKNRQTHTSPCSFELRQGVTGRSWIMQTALGSLKQELEGGLS